MTHTVLSSATREVVIGFDRPFVIIGERINAVLARRPGIRFRGSPVATTPEAAAARPVGLWCGGGLR
jgi:5-methyltetrahydrofolate--homocysteine methyltransferase